MNVPVTKLWIPGMGEVNLEEYRVHKAVQEYDERLMFGRNMDTGDWCIFVKMPRGEDPVAVLGFGKRVPDPREAVQRADAANTRKHGAQIIEAMEKHNRALDAEKALRTGELSEVGAEILEYGFRKQGAHPSPRVFFPGKGD